MQPVVHEPRTQIEISHASYGKDAVRVLTWTRAGRLDTVRDVSLRVHVEGEFLASYLAGDNTAILPSDTLRRHALAECDAQSDGTVEAVLAGIAGRILDANAALTAVTAAAETRQWQRIGDHSFIRAPWQGTAEVRCMRGCPPRVRSGVRDLSVLTTAGSRFTGFMRDALTTQAEAADRPLCGSLDADWTYVAAEGPPAGLTGEIVATLCSTLADRTSNGIQQLLTDVGSEVLERTPELESLALHFESVPAAPIPGDLATPDGGRGHELGVGAIGVTDVILRRP